MRSFINFLWSGFGTGTMAGRALGITILIVLAAFLVAWYIIAGIIRIVKKNKSKSASSNN